jgi:hypothetical protein
MHDKKYRVHQQYKYRIHLRNAAGRDRYEVAHGRTENQACGFAAKRVEHETGERWYAVTALRY